MKNYLISKLELLQLKHGYHSCPFGTGGWCLEEEVNYLELKSSSKKCQKYKSMALVILSTLYSCKNKLIHFAKCQTHCVFQCVNRFIHVVCIFNSSERLLLFGSWAVTLHRYYGYIDHTLKCLSCARVIIGEESVMWTNVKKQVLIFPSTLALFKCPHPFQRGC